MNSVTGYIFAALQITLLDIVLSGDNVGIIALSIRNLNAKDSKRAILIGVFGAISMRILFASLAAAILKIEWLPIRLAGGILLLKITWNLINQDEKTHGKSYIESSAGFWHAVCNIIIADMSMSLDNAIAIAGAADGQIALIIFGIALNIPIILLGSQYVADVMNKYRITIYIGGAILIHTALSMMMKDKLLLPYVNDMAALVIPWVFAIFILIYGILKIKRNHRNVNAR